VRQDIIAEKNGRTKMLISWQLGGKERKRKGLGTSYTLQENNPNDSLSPMNLLKKLNFLARHDDSWCNLSYSGSRIWEDQGL
jgi:hypothetical protein